MINKLKVLVSRSFTPSRIFILSFLFVILAGALALRLPFATKSSQITFVDALFTSASAVCVTGLTVLDIGKELSFAGQITTLLLFQTGGLGIVTFSVLLFGLMGRGISFKGREIVQTTFLYAPRRDFFVILKRVLSLTLIIESAGTVLLLIRFAQDFHWGRAFYLALYHAVSAFNNCGYSLFSDNLMSYRDDWLVNLTVMALIILGGIGFVVQHEVVTRLQGFERRLSLHAKIVIITTLVLIVVGAVSFYFFEMDHMLRDKSLLSSILVSFFHSVTARTCGFNTVDIGQLANSTILVLIVLMFIGASPGSTGGGIKTTSFAILLLIIWNQIKGNEDVNVFNRTIPKEILNRTIAIIFAAALSVGVVASILLFLGSTGELSPQASRHFFVEYIFETVSAFGTVGLSMGGTPNLNDAQKMAVIIMMFAGRVGPLTLAFAWHSSKTKCLVYAEETVMVG
ncbi:MAG: TrkH family potassium uptake protein [Syntrophales bacterium]|nr:TrkH family potassium uptake protein [Syntrophales bacterium]